MKSSISNFINLFLFFLRWMFRNNHQLLVVGFQTLIVLFLLALGFSSDPKTTTHVPSIFLICMFFMGQFFFMETHAKFKAERTLQSLLLTGTSPFLIYVSFGLMAFLMLLTIQAFLLCLMVFFFNLTFSLASTFLLWLVTSIGMLSYVALGTLYYGMSVFSKLPLTFIMILFFPMCIPIFLQTHTVLDAVLDPSKIIFIQPLLGMALLFVFLSGLLYEFITESKI